MRNTIGRTLTITTAALLAISAPWAASAQERVDERKPATADGRVSIYNVSGSLRITGWERNEVYVKGTLGEGTEGLDFTISGGTTSIEVVLPRGAEARNRTVKGTNLEISLPAGSRVDVRTVSADIWIHTVSGEVELDSVSGNIRVMDVPLSVQAESMSGDIEVENAEGSVRAKSVSGRVSVTRAVGTFDLSTVSGDLTVTGMDITDGKCSSLSGDIRFDGTLGGSGRLEIESHSGTIEVAVPANVSAEFDVTTFSGGIKNEFGQEPESRSRYGPGKFLRFTNGSGAARISISSFAGTVVIRRKG